MTTYAEPGHIPKPDIGESPNGPVHIGAVSDRQAALLTAHTTASRDALAGTDLWVGRTLWNVTTGRLEVWDGDSWEPVADLSGHTAASDPHTGYIRKALATAKGDLLVATASGVVVRKAVGANGRVLTADSAQSDGLAWTDLSGTYLAKAAVAGYVETLTTLATSGTVTLDFAVSNAWYIAPTGAVTIAFANLPAAGKVAPGTLIVANSGFAITWPVGTKYPGAAAPALDGETWLSLVARSTHVTVGAAWAGVA